MFSSVIGFLAILGPLVVVHEFGHYIFARIFNVKAEVFSIGFGPRIWAKQLGETELRIAAIPLGGFVKLLGEDPDAELTPAEQKRALQRQKPWKRFLIFFGGPLFNFLFAILVFMAILVIGEEQVASVANRVVRGSPAEKAGFVSGDRILAINGKPVRKFEEIISEINDHPSKVMRFDLSHPDAQGAQNKRTIEITPTVQPGFSVYGESTDVGEIQGLLASGRATQVGISDVASLAGKAGFKTGDSIAEFAGRKIGSWEELERVYASAPAGDVAIKTEAGKTLTLRKPADAKLTMASAWGLHSSELFIDKTIEASPAEKTGLKKGDRLVKIGGVEMQSFFDLKDAVQRAGERDGKVPVEWEREGRRMTADIVPTATSQRDPLLKKTVQYTIGVVPMLQWSEPEMVIDRVWNPFTLLFEGTKRMVVFSWRNIVSLGKMVTGDVSVATLGGPILIGKLAGESMSRGLIAFLSMMAVLSVGLGVLNLLPVPVLDGGHLLLLAIESVRGKPLTIRQMEVIQQVGLSLILLLMVIVMRNDLARLPLFN